jgi:hypothetical protein
MLLLEDGQLLSKSCVFQKQIAARAKNPDR